MHGPVYWLRRVLDKLDRVWRAGGPWLTRASVRFLDEHLPRDGLGLEWGSGRSTLWFARRLGHLTSVEFDPDWYRRVQRKLDDVDADNVDLQYVPVEDDDVAAGTGQSQQPAYVAVADSFPEESLAVRPCRRSPQGGLRARGPLEDQAGWIPRNR